MPLALGYNCRIHGFCIFGYFTQQRRFDWKKYCTPQPYCGQDICVIPLHCSYGQIGYTVYFPYADMPEVEYDWEMNKLTIDKENWESYLT